MYCYNCNVISINTVQVKSFCIKSFILYYTEPFAVNIFRRTFLINFRNARINLSEVYLRTDGQINGCRSAEHVLSHLPQRKETLDVKHLTIFLHFRRFACSRMHVCV